MKLKFSCYFTLKFAVRLLVITSINLISFKYFSFKESGTIYGSIWHDMIVLVSNSVFIALYLSVLEKALKTWYLIGFVILFVFEQLPMAYVSYTNVQADALFFYNVLLSYGFYFFIMFIWLFKLSISLLHLDPLFQNFIFLMLWNGLVFSLAALFMEAITKSIIFFASNVISKINRHKQA